MLTLPSQRIKSKDGRFEIRLKQKANAAGHYVECSLWKKERHSWKPTGRIATVPLELPLLIIAHWKPIADFFGNLFKTIGDGLATFGKWLGIGGGNVLVTTSPAYNARFGTGSSSYAKLSPGARGSGDVHIHNNIHPGAIVVHAAPGQEAKAGNAVYSAITRQAVTASRSRGIRPATSYAR
jgi:hypothetical protein